jgi:competence protein ComEC
VLRAEAMAAIAMVAQVLGRPVSTIRLLALAVTGLLLLDPLLVGSVGFLLSVGACAGIALLAEPLAAILPGPRTVATAVGVTLAAQAGVAPVLVPVFGPVPVATVPANLLAVPAAGPVMIWGVVAGLPAGLVGGSVARVLHVPTRLLVGWIALVARTAGGAPLGRLGAPALAVMAALLAVALGVRTARRPALAATAVLLVSPAVLLAIRDPPPLDGRPLVSGARLWRSGGAVVLVIDRPDPGRLLAAVRAADVRRIDVVVVRRGGARSVGALDPLARRVAIGTVIAPRGDGFTGPVVVARPGLVARAGGLQVRVVSVSPVLDARVERGPPRSEPGAGPARPSVPGR